MNYINTSMNTATNLAPTRYEVIKLRTGLDIVGMVRDVQGGISVTLPMICQLQLQASHDTLATFIPYAPLSAEPTLHIPSDHIVHRNQLNNQFVSFYDAASSKWMEMVENGTIPVRTHEEFQRSIQDYVDHAMKDVGKNLLQATGGPITNEELRKLAILEEEEWDDEFINEAYEDWMLNKGNKTVH